MAKKTTNDIVDDVKKATEKATEALTDAAATAVESAKPVVEKAKKAAAPTVKKVKDASKTAAAAAKKVTPKKPECYVQFGGKEIDMNDLVEQAKAAFKAENNRAAVLSCRVYLKPEDSTAYYVVNDTFFGKLAL